MPLSVGSCMRFYVEEGKGNVQVGSFVSRNGPVTVRQPGGSIDSHLGGGRKYWRFLGDHFVFRKN